MFKLVLNLPKHKLTPIDYMTSINKFRLPLKPILDAVKTNFQKKKSMKGFG